MRTVAIPLLCLACSCRGREVAVPGSPHSLLVLVRAAGDAPVPGARVELFPGPEEELTDEDAMRFRPLAAPPRALSTAVTDAKGAAALDLPPAGRYWVSAVAPGLGRGTVGATVVAGEEPPQVVVPLVPGHALEGTVTMMPWEPLAGIEVVAAPTWRCRPWPCDAACVRTVTDDSGRFRFDALAPGEYAIWHQPVEPVIAVHGHAGPARAYRPAGDALVSAGSVCVPLGPYLPVHPHLGGYVCGVVRDKQSGSTVSGSVVRLLDDEHEVVAEARTDAEGRFAVHTNREECVVWNVAVASAGYAPTPVGTADNLPGHFADGQVLDLDLKLQKGATLRGRLLGPTGAIPGASVSLFGEDKKAVTGANGEYRFEDLDPGPYSLDVDRLDAGAYVDVAAGADAVHDMRVEPSPSNSEVHQVKGRVVDWEGGAVRGARVRDGPRSETRTDAQGRFALQVTAFDGDAVITADPPPGSDLVRDDHWLDEFDGEVEIQLVYGARVRGRVRAADGSPVAGARVAAGSGEAGSEVYFYHFESLREGLTGPDGSYEVHNPDGVEFLRVTSPADGATAWTWDFDDDGKTLRGDVTMPRARLVSGRAAATGSGEGIGGLLVSLVIEAGVPEAKTFHVPGAAICAVTDAEGRFRVPFPADERAAIEVSGAGYVPRRVRPGDKDLVVEMRPVLPVSGVVRREDGKLAYLATVELRGEDDWTSKPSTADTDGRFILRGVPAGDYALVVDGVEVSQVRAGASGVEVMAPAGK